MQAPTVCVWLWAVSHSACQRWPTSRVCGTVAALFEFKTSCSDHRFNGRPMTGMQVSSETETITVTFDGFVGTIQLQVAASSEIKLAVNACECTVHMRQYCFCLFLLHSTHFMRIF